MITLNNISKTYKISDNTSLLAVNDISFSFEKNKFYSIAGPSGCGKTTLLRILAGIINPSEGRMEWQLPSLSMVFQDDDLFPWLTIENNIRLAIKKSAADIDAQNTIIHSILKKVGLAEFKDFYPAQLSGGMKKRASIARALCVEPSLILMDEPFNSLDHHTRNELHDLVIKIYQEKPRTFIFVTHDIYEAIKLSQTIIVMTARPGKFKAVIDVSLPYPRGIEAMSGKEYVGLFKQIAELLK